MRGLLAASIALVLSSNAVALDIDWATFKANHWSSVSSADADGFAEAFRTVVRDQTLAGNVVAVGEQPIFPTANSNMIGFYDSAKYDSSTCVVDYAALDFSCTIDGTQARFGTIPTRYDQATDFMWWSGFNAALDVEYPGSSGLMNSWLAALSSCFVAANSDVTGSTGGRCYLGRAGFFRQSPRTGAISFSGTEIPILAPVAGDELIDGVTFNATTASGLGNILKYNTATGTASLNNGTATDVSTGGAFTLTGSAGATLQITVDAEALPSNSATGIDSAFMSN